MRWLAAIVYLIAGGVGAFFGIVLGIWFLLGLSIPGGILLLLLDVVSLALLVAGVMGFFRPAKGARLAWRVSIPGLCLLALGTVLELSGALTPSGHFGTWFLLCFALGPAMLLAACLWTASKLKNA